MLLILALLGVCAPLLAAGLPCGREEGDEDCDVDCAVCLCCLQAQAALNAVGNGYTDDGLGNVGVWDGRMPPTPLPRDILHVPRPTLSR